MNGTSRMSKINDHNIYTDTDKLYEPLRNTIRKSTLSQNKLISSSALNNKNSNSRVSKNMRSLSPM